MTARAKFTQAELERAIRAARSQGGHAVEVENGIVRIVFDGRSSAAAQPYVNPADLLEE